MRPRWGMCRNVGHRSTDAGLPVHAHLPNSCLSDGGEQCDSLGAISSVPIPLAQPHSLALALQTRPNTSLRSNIPALQQHSWSRDSHCNDNRDRMPMNLRGNVHSANEILWVCSSGTRSATPPPPPHSFSACTFTLPTFGRYALTFNPSDFPTNGRSSSPW